jgi:oligopeptide transport system substrate-binding protein
LRYDPPQRRDVAAIREEGLAVPRSIPIVALLVFTLLGAPLLSHPPAAAGQDVESGKVLHIEYNHYPNTLDPQLTADISEDMVTGLGFEGLTRIDTELATVPGAAESWEFSEDGLTLTFRLRDGLVYSDGSPLTAERFRYAIERTCDPRLESVNASFLFVVAGCEAFFTSLEPETDAADATPAGGADAAYEAARSNLGVRAVDDQTLEIQLDQPAVYFPALASMAMFYPAKQELIETGDPDWWRDAANLIGNGPFQIARIDPEGGEPAKIVFAANERYWDGRPRLDSIEYLHFSAHRTGEQRLQQYRDGILDMVWLGWEDFPTVEVDLVLSKDLLQTPRAATIFMTFDLDREPFTDAKVREAFAYGFDREGYCREVQFGFCSPTLSWIPTGVPGAIETDAFAFDAEKARQALADSSYGGPEKLPEITWYYSEGSEEAEDEARWLADLYRSVLGIELNLVPLQDDEWDTVPEAPDSGPRLSTSGWWQAYPDPQYWLSAVWTCNSGHNDAGYCNPAFDELVARADAELDPATRSALYEEAGRMLVDDVPAIFLYNWSEAMLIKPYVTGYATTLIDHFPGWTTPLTIDVDRPA